jgi:nucleoside-diphosphate-sugar epimerase
MKVALIGGTGFVGNYLVDELIRQAHDPVLLVRPGSESKVSIFEQTGLFCQMIRLVRAGLCPPLWFRDPR